MQIYSDKCKVAVNKAVNGNLSACRFLMSIFETHVLFNIHSKFMAWGGTKMMKSPVMYKIKHLCSLM